MPTENMIRIPIETHTPYEVLIGKGVLANTGTEIRRVAAEAKKAFIVSDDTVLALYGKSVRDSLVAAGFRVYTLAFAHGEEHKTLATAEKILSTLCAAEITRTDVLVALGGGVVGDVCGFVAAIYLRGVKFVQIPTTLLAAVDSSVGGKTGVDLPAGKNLAGAFKQPKFVAIDTDFLETLPETEIKNGLGELIKYAVIDGGEILTMLEDGFGKNVQKIVEAAVDIKRRVVEADEKESGLRRILNFGHTPAHAAEKLSGFTLPHGVAVAAGVNLMLRASVRKADCPARDAQRIERLCVKYGLPVAFEYTAKRLAEASAGDKKTEGEFINLVLADKIGSVFSIKVPKAELEEYYL